MRDLSHTPTPAGRTGRTGPRATLSERLVALKDHLPAPHGGNYDISVDAAHLLDEAAAALARAEADSRRLDKLASDPSCLRSIGHVVYWDSPKGARRMGDPRQVLDAAISWDAEAADARLSASDNVPGSPPANVAEGKR